MVQTRADTGGFDLAKLQQGSLSGLQYNSASPKTVRIRVRAPEWTRDGRLSSNNFKELPVSTTNLMQVDEIKCVLNLVDCKNG